MKKSVFKKYEDYLKNNPEGYWFKRKLYGWGWVPVKLQGWIVILIFISVLVLNGIYFESAIPNGGGPSTASLTLFFVVIIFAVIAMIMICYAKGEKPRWGWGI